MKTIAQTKKFLKDAFSGPGGSYDNYHKYAGDLTWLQVTGTAMLHEMMHTDLIGNPGPHIDDEWVDPDNIGRKAYGPKAVWQLANRAISKGGGAKRASTNADSYAQMVTAMYWWKANSHPFPGVPGKRKPSFLTTIPWSNFVSAFAGDDGIPNDPDANDNDAPVTPSNWDTIPIFLDLGNATDPNTDWESLYTAAADPSFFPTPTATATATAAPNGLPSDIADHSVCGGCPGNRDKNRNRQ
jgi:hypothetical protein